MIQTPEHIAAIRLRAAVDAMRAAASELDALDMDGARAKAREMRGASRIAAGWARHLEASHRARQAQDDEQARDDRAIADNLDV